MRQTQIFGLPPAAIDFLAANCRKIPHMCPKCQHVLQEAYDEYVYEDARSSGMADDGPLLHAYRLTDGRIVQEVIQTIPWSSGPCIFLRLEDLDEHALFEWSDDQITERV